MSQIRPELAVLQVHIKVRNAATVAVHAQQYVLTLSAVSCRSRTFGERQVCLRIQLIDVTHALTN
jgi:hypothetical protein